MSAPLLITLLLVGATFFVTNSGAKKFLYLSIPAVAIIVIIAYIFVSWADHDRLREEVDQLRREFTIYREIDRGRVRRLEGDLAQVKAKLYSELAVRSMDLKDSDFAEALNQFLSTSMGDRDG